MAKQIVEPTRRQAAVGIPRVRDRLRPEIGRRLRSVRAYPQLVIGTLVLTVLAVSAILAPVVAPYDPTAIDARALGEVPSRDHLFGTDSLGRDVFSRIVFGGRLTLFVAITAVLCGMAIGIVLGLVSGYRLGWVDSLIMRVMDGLIAFPSLVLALTIAFALGASLRSVIIALAVVRIPPTARLTRGQALALQNEDYILAARAVGVGPARTISRHFLPNLVNILLIQASLGAGATVFAEASLGFLGLGVPPPAPSWGGMLRDGYIFLEINPWQSIIPGAFIFLAVLSFNFIGDGLRDVLDPRQRRRRLAGRVTSEAT
jgi:ABC-type dipeptide/oligopeptide/nickel transport system permease subunit